MTIHAAPRALALSRPTLRAVEKSTHECLMTASLPLATAAARSTVLSVMPVSTMSTRSTWSMTLWIASVISRSRLPVIVTLTMAVDLTRFSALFSFGRAIHRSTDVV